MLQDPVEPFLHPWNSRDITFFLVKRGGMVEQLWKFTLPERRKDVITFKDLYLPGMTKSHSKYLLTEKIVTIRVKFTFIRSDVKTSEIYYKKKK